MLTIDDICAVRHTVTDWLSIVGGTAPPVPIYEIAGALNRPVVMVASAAGKLAERRERYGRAEIVVNTQAVGDPIVARRRRRFAVAHELMALEFPEYGNAFGGDSERVYQQLASELVLYRPWLEDCVGRRGWSLPDIVRDMDASWEATARALLDLEECVLTIWDNAQMTARVGSGDLRYPPGLLGAEYEALAHAHDAWEEREARDDLVRVHAWPVDPPGRHVKRVMAFTWARAG